MQGKCKEWLKHSRRPEMGWKIKPRVYPWLFTMIFFEAERCSHWRFGVRSAASPFGNYDPSCEMLRYGRCEHQNLCQTLPKNFHAIVRARDSDTMIFVIFRTLYAFPEIKIPTRPTPLAAPCGRTVWSFFPVSRTMNENSQSDTQMILLTRTCSCDYIYTYKRDLFFCIFKVWDC